MLSDATNGGLVETPGTRRKRAKKVNKRVGLRSGRGGKDDAGGGTSACLVRLSSGDPHVSVETTQGGN